MTKKYQLPKEFAEKWVSALRSEEYKQIQGVLTHPDTDCFCALGVCAKVNDFQFDAIGEQAWKGGISIYSQLDFAGGDGHLSNTIYRLNDGQELSFPEIADWIEANVEFVTA